MPVSCRRAVQPTVQAVLLAVALVPTASAQAGPYRPPPGSLATSSIMWHLDSACTAGALPACDTIGMHHWATRDKAERRVAVSIWERVCTAGGSGACANLALAYDEGSGVRRDRGRALALARQACDSGAAPACVTVASMLSDGRAGEQDEVAGTAFMERACTMADLFGCMNMGYRALKGSFGVARDSTRARAFMKRACTVAVAEHPYPWYRETAKDACDLARQLGGR